MLRFRDVEMDLIKRTATRGGASIELVPQEFKLLEFLGRHAGQLVTRAMILENVCSFRFEPRTNIVEGHISRTRSKAEQGSDREFVRTVQGAGYQTHDDA